MNRTVVRFITLLLILCLSFPSAILAQSPVPDELPADLGGKTLYGYLTDLKKLYAPPTVFSDHVRYSDQDRENARGAVRLIIDATTEIMEKAGKPDQYNLYLRGFSYDLQFQDTKDPALRLKALEDYKETAALGGAYAKADHDRLAAMQVQAAPLAWQVPQILTLEEMGQIIGAQGGSLFYVKSAYQRDDGSKLGAGYALRGLQEPAQSAVFILADPQGGKSRYDTLKRFAYLNKTRDIPGLGDEAVTMGLRNTDNDPRLYTTALVLKDTLVLQVRVPDHAWRSAGLTADPAQTATEIAAKFLENLYDGGRSVPDMQAVVLEDIISPRRLPAGTANSPVPDGIPQDLGGKTTYGYLVELRSTYLPRNVFTDINYNESDRNNARRALRLIAESISFGLDLSGPNPYELEIRGACYAAAYEDTGDPVYRMLAINDYKQALSRGFALVKPAYDLLAAPLLADMAGLEPGASGALVFNLQAWLIQAGSLKGKASGTFDDATRQAIEAFEIETGLTPDGVADIACLLALYSRIDDMDALYLRK